MFSTRFWIMASVCLCAALMLSCGKDPTAPTEAKTFKGKIISIDGDQVSWDGLRFGLITFATLEVMGEERYHAGEAYCVMDIGADSTFSFNLPAEINSRWILSGFSCGFSPVVYNDTSGNGVFDFEPEPEPYEILFENGQTVRLFMYISDTKTLQDLGWEVSLGWNYSESMTQYSTDFDREFMMGTPTP